MSKQNSRERGVNTVQLVEQHCIRKSDPRYSVIDDAAFKSKNLYNAALYEMRQAFIHHGVYLSYEEMDTRMQPTKSCRRRCHNTCSSNSLMRGKPFVRQKRPMKRTRPRSPDGHDCLSTSTKRRGATFLLTPCKR